MAFTSAGILMYKVEKGKLKLFIAHPGGPFWRGKNDHTWCIPKGRPNTGEDLFACALREFKEETGIRLPRSKKKYQTLGETKTSSGNIIHIWAYEGDWDGKLRGTSYAKTEWPLKSGKIITVLEIDRAGFFTLFQSKKKLRESQWIFIERLKEYLSHKSL